MSRLIPRVRDPRFASLRQKLTSLADGLPPLPSKPASWSGDAPSPPGSPPSPARTDAAVALVLREGPDLDLLLIRRAEAHGDPWSGHMALPGGRWDAGDPDLFHTAVRETLEETGVRLSGEGDPLGRLAALNPATRRLPPITIYPFVFSVSRGTEVNASSHEVDEVLWVPLADLTAPSSAGMVEIELHDARRDFPCLRVDGRVIWGLTYRILDQFLPLLSG